jgi:hypothetical protein
MDHRVKPGGDGAKRSASRVARGISPRAAPAPPFVQKRQSTGVIGSQLRRAAKFVLAFPEILAGLTLATQLSCDSRGKAE